MVYRNITRRIIKWTEKKTTTKNCLKWENNSKPHHGTKWSEAYRVIQFNKGLLSPNKQTKIKTKKDVVKVNLNDVKLSCKFSVLFCEKLLKLPAFSPQAQTSPLLSCFDHLYAVHCLVC